MCIWRQLELTLAIFSWIYRTHSQNDKCVGMQRWSFTRIRLVCWAEQRAAASVRNDDTTWSLVKINIISPSLVAPERWKRQGRWFLSSFMTPRCYLWSWMIFTTLHQIKWKRWSTQNISGLMTNINDSRQNTFPPRNIRYTRLLTQTAKQFFTMITVYCSYWFTHLVAIIEL